MKIEIQTDRKFRTGDVVHCANRLWELIEDEKDGGFLYMAWGACIKTAHLSEVKLVIAVEDRADKKEIQA